MEKGVQWTHRVKVASFTTQMLQVILQDLDFKQNCSGCRTSDYKFSDPRPSIIYHMHHQHLDTSFLIHEHETKTVGKDIAVN